MTPPRLAACLLLLPLVLLCAGCVNLEPNRITYAYEHDEAETTGGARRTRTGTDKFGVQATYELR